MGQCAVYGYRQDESDASVVTTEGTVYSAQKENAKGFLVPHVHDLPMRSILDPYHVQDIVYHQADAMSRQTEHLSRLKRERQRQLSAELHDDDDGQTEHLSRQKRERQRQLPAELHDDNDSEGDYAVSTIAPTEVTSFSVATRLASNFDKYAEAKKQKPMETNPPPCRQDIPRNRSKQRVMEAINENNSFDSINGSISTTSYRTSILNNSVHQGRIKSSQKDAFGFLFRSCICARPPKLTKFSNEAFYNVLHLKMKFNLADYYLNHYLVMFPESITPAGMMHTTAATFGRTGEGAPRLNSASSDTSSRSSETPGVGFGSGIPSCPVCLLADDSVFMDLAITGSLGLVDRNSGPASPEAASSLKQKSPEHYIVLINRRSGFPLAVCALKSRNGPPIVRIYATKQRVLGQRPAASTGELRLTWTDSYPLFAWAEVTTEGEFPMPTRYSLYMASGSAGHFEKEPSYLASHQTTGSPDITMVGRTQTETEYSGCALLSMVADEQNDEPPFLSLSISRGIDPALLICFAAIVDETMEKTMRLHCELNTRKELRRSRSKRFGRGAKT
jgi:hypothetical protein